MTSFQLPPRSHRAQMTSVASSEKARSVIAELATTIEAHERETKERKYQRNKRAQSFQNTLGAIVGELLFASALSEFDGWLTWPLEKAKYTDLPFSQRDVSNVIDSLCELGLLEFVRGRPHFSKNPFVETGPIVKSAGYTSRLRLSVSGLEWFSERNVTGQNYTEHFDDSTPLNPVVLRSSSRRVNNEKLKGSTLPLPKSPKAKAIIAELEKINSFLSGYTMRPTPFRGLYRLYNEADHPDFDFDRGGRLYGAGNESYQTLGKDERLALRIDDDPVAEIDISSSFLTIVYGLLGVPFDNTADPYAIDGFERDLVKKWTVATLSSGTLARWPAGTPANYLEKTSRKIPPVTAVRAAMEAKHPVLAEWARSPWSWSTLMWHESEIIMAALNALKAHGRPAYPVHDSIIVREQDTCIALETLRAAFRYKLKVVPSLSVSTLGMNR